MYRYGFLRLRKTFNNWKTRKPTSFNVDGPQQQNHTHTPWKRIFSTLSAPTKRSKLLPTSPREVGLIGIGVGIGAVGVLVYQKTLYYKSSLSKGENEGDGSSGEVGQLESGEVDDDRLKKYKEAAGNDSLIVNTDCGTIRLFYNNYVHIAAAVARTPDGVPKLAAIQKVENPTIQNDEHHMCILYEKVQKVIDDQQHHRYDEAEASAGEVLILIEQAKEQGILLGRPRAIVDSLTSKIDMDGLDLQELQKLEGLVGKFIRYEYGMRKTCEVILEGELFALLLGLELVDDNISIAIKSDSSDGVKKILDLYPVPLTTVKKKEKDSWRKISDDARRARIEKLLNQIVEKLKKKKRVISIEHAVRERNVLADEFAKYGKEKFRDDPKSFQLLRFTEREIADIKFEPIKDTIEKERKDKSIWLF